MNTVFLLMAEFGSGQIELEKVCDKYLGMDAAKAKRLAGTQSLPFPVMRDETSQKRPYLVSIADLAKWLDEMNEKARNTWLKMNNAA